MDFLSKPFVLGLVDEDYIVMVHLQVQLKGEPEPEVEIPTSSPFIIIFK